ncbi:MAG: N-acetyl-gamma-glutamyl-phosphate reductase [Ruminococcus sp.]|jgi:N-acetyl-gamma-glutamyl-phosphate reductase|nr:N-acetyl-gamma-glutamyl-phosphate reductase [Ruminococcus sp.]
MKKIFIDGAAGTTGLKLRERLELRADITLLEIDEAERKNADVRKKLINEADAVFLCLPDEAAKEAVTLCENPDTVIIDASTAHRTAPGWAYGLPELSAKHREEIKSSKRIAVPGCYASGFVSLVYPLLEERVIQPYYPMTCFAVSGYSGQGNKGIEKYENPDRAPETYAPQMYSMGKRHKHIAEMMQKTGLSYAPVFSPSVDDYFAGMLVSVPLHMRLLAKKITAPELWKAFLEHYEDQNFVRVMPFGGENLKDGLLAANGLAGTNIMEIYIFGDNEHILLTARLDNLGKGASGAAVQCMNIAFGLPETTGLL